MTTLHECNADPDKWRVCSRFVTREMLEGWGYAVYHKDTSFGAYVITPGLPKHKVLHQAWLDDLVRICTTSRSMEKASR